MTIIGPFWRRRATTSTMHQEWAWCYLWLNGYGHVVAIEWCD